VSQTWMPQRRKGTVIINVVAGKNRLPRFQPDPATVVLGETVTWKLRYAGANDPIEMTVYFDHGTPFPKWKTLSAKTEQERHGVSEGSLDGGKVEETGDYKYGVRLSNARTKEKLSDDDPYIKVISVGAV
jgi:hypothetical protein